MCNVKLVMQKRKRKRERDRKREKKSLRMPGDEPRAPLELLPLHKVKHLHSKSQHGGKKKTDLKNMIASAKNQTKQKTACVSE